MSNLKALAGTFILGGGAALDINQHAAQAASRAPAAQVEHATSCGSLGMGYLPETNQFYCVPYGG